MPHFSGSEVEILMEIKYSQMILKDLDRIMEIERETFSNPWEESMFYSSLDYYLCWKLEDKESHRIIGYLIGEQVIDEFSIYNLAICREYQKQGLGSWFTNEILNCMRDNGVRVFFLEVRRSNKAALNLYRKIGFKEVYIRERYYVKPVEDALVMMKDERNNEKG